MNAIVFALASVAVLATPAIAGSAEVEACKAAFYAAGHPAGYPEGACPDSYASQYTVSQWMCMAGQMSQGKDIGYATGYCT